MSVATVSTENETQVPELPNVPFFKRPVVRALRPNLDYAIGGGVVFAGLMPLSVLFPAGDPLAQVIGFAAWAAALGGLAALAAGYANVRAALNEGKSLADLAWSPTPEVMLKRKRRQTLQRRQEELHEEERPRRRRRYRTSVRTRRVRDDEHERRERSRR